jgi:hypothetical protein
MGGRATFVTFASREFRPSARRLLHEVVDGTDAFDTHVIVRAETDMPEFAAAHAPALQHGTKGFGHMIWKPYIVRRELDRMAEGDVLVYCDAGCAFNAHGGRRLADYLRKARESPSGFVCFRLYGHTNEEWTKGDVLAELDPEGRFRGERQVTSCVFFVRKCAESIALVDAWLDPVMRGAYNMFDDSPSARAPDPPCFKGHRHDQSVLSLLCYTHGATFVDDETYFFRAFFPNGMAYPFWALRRREP